MAASVVTLLEEFIDSSGNTTTRGPTSSYTPSGDAGTILVAVICNAHFQGAPVPTVDDPTNGKTWTLRASNAWSNADDERQITVFTADGSGATADSMTVTYPANDALTFFTIFEFTLGDSSSVVVQEVSDRTNNSGGDSGTSTGETLTFAAVGDAENLLILVSLINNASLNIVPGTGWTQLGADQTDNGPQTTMMLQTGANDTSADSSWTSDVRWGQVGVEFTHLELVPAKPITATLTVSRYPNEHRQHQVFA